jgi:diaminopimelate epimerase
MAIDICDRHTGIGADGWLLVSPSGPGYDGAIHLYNSDGSDSEISGNGTRCAAAFLLEAGIGSDTVTIATGAGPKVLRLLERNGHSFLFEMNMGRPTIEDGDLLFPLPMPEGTRDVTILNVGNPQCAVFVDNFDFDWRAIGRYIEWHSHFPKRTNVSFVRPAGGHSIEVRIWERGAGETLSSGTGCTGAAAAAILRGVVKSPVEVVAPAGPLHLRWDEEIFLTGPAQIIAGGEFYRQTDSN